MKHRTKHVYAITVAPVVAQNNFQALLNFKTSVMTRFSSLQRSAQWGISFKGSTTTT
ncbi:MAG TPA: hypothetical protein PLO62_00285 [Candidatus Hydrogenedentes bacterium]|nr:hypothetical protein [Candidatus Hydrogenedentota bacterium]